MPIPLGILAVAGAGAGGGGGPAFDLLETTVLSSSASSVTFSSLGSYSDYKHLQLRVTARSTDSPSHGTVVILRLNSDSGNNYARHQLEGNGSAVSSSATASTSSIFIGRFPAASATANGFGAGVIDILDFSNVSKNTTIRALGGKTTGTDDGIGLYSGLWNNTAAVTTITLTTAANYATGSRFSLYGIK